MSQSERFLTFIFGVMAAESTSSAPWELTDEEKHAEYITATREECKIVDYRGLWDNKSTWYRYKGCVFQDKCLSRVLQIRKEFTPRENDILICSFPKTGTTWLQELSYVVSNGITEAKSDYLHLRCPYLERVEGGLPYVNDMASPRFMKTHLPYNLLPDSIKDDRSIKILYIARNPKDVLISYYHFTQMIMIFNFKGNLEDFADFMLKDEVEYCPMPHHFLSYWERRNQDNVLFFKYEDLQKDLGGQIRKLANFLGKELTPEQVIQTAQHCSFASMAENPLTNFSYCEETGELTGKFFRKGKVGDWKNWLSPELNRRLDDWMREKFQGSGLEFDYE